MTTTTLWLYDEALLSTHTSTLEQQHMVESWLTIAVAALHYSRYVHVVCTSATSYCRCGVCVTLETVMCTLQLDQHYWHA
jgi:hypothetical protein